jgi:aspartate carbamoyltransferase catalytic subunit
MVETLTRRKTLPPIKTHLPSEKINGDFKSRDILSMDQFDKISLYRLFRLTNDMKKIAERAKHRKNLEGNIFVELFCEASSRTIGSFDAAAKQLGGDTIAINDITKTSMAKGESLKHTVQNFEAYADTIILRHPDIGSAKKAAAYATRVPIINGGDGIGEHPTQALLDLYTILQEKKTLSGLKILITGDLLNGRTAHSLLKGLSLFPNNTVYLLSPDQLRLQKSLIDEVKGKGLNMIEISDEKDMPKDCDVWYWTRVQKERFEKQEEYEKVKGKFILNKELLGKYGNERLIIMHPQPIVDEIAEEIDDDPRAIYLKSQVRNGMYIRMGLLTMIMGKEGLWYKLKERAKVWDKPKIIKGEIYPNFKKVLQ